MTFSYAKIYGSLTLDPDLQNHIKNFIDSASTYDDELAHENGVASLAWPKWLKKGIFKEPSITEKLSDLGLKVQGRGAMFLLSNGVDYHSDGIGYNTLCLVLYNSRFEFKQQGTPVVRCSPNDGDWFIFNDGAEHALQDRKGSTYFLCVTIPVTKIKD